MPRAASFSWNSRPSISGMRTSVTMQAGSRALQDSRASRAASKAWTAWPADSSSSCSESRTASSSSTIKTSLSAGIMTILICQRNCKAEGDAAFGVRGRVQSTTMGVDDRSANRQAQPHALCLGGLERLEQLGLDLRRKARAGIRDGDLRQRSIGARLHGDGRDQHMPRWRALRHGFNAVADEIEDDLLDLDLVDEDRQGGGTEIDSYGDTGFLGAHEAERSCFADDLVEILDPPLRVAFLDEVAEVLHDCAGARSLTDRFVHRIGRLWGNFQALALQHPARGLNIVENGRQGLVELVRDRRRHLPDIAQP